MEQFLTALPGLITGPAAAVIILAVILYGIHNLLIKYLIPIAQDQLKQTQDNLEKIMDEHKEDREAYLEGISSVNKRLDHIDNRLEDIEEKIN